MQYHKFNKINFINKYDAKNDLPSDLNYFSSIRTIQQSDSKTRIQIRFGHLKSLAFVCKLNEMVDYS